MPSKRQAKLNWTPSQAQLDAKGSQDCPKTLFRVPQTPVLVESGSCGEPFGLAKHCVCCTSAFLQKNSPFSLPDLPLERFWVILPLFSSPKVIKNAPENDPGSLLGPFGVPFDARNHPKALPGSIFEPPGRQNAKPSGFKGSESS